MTCRGDSHVWVEPGPCQCGKKWLQVNGKIRDVQGEAR